MKIEDASIGSYVVYIPCINGPQEEGIIIDYNKKYIFVRYNHNSSVMATYPSELKLLDKKSK